MTKAFYEGLGAYRIKGHMTEDVQRLLRNAGLDPWECQQQYDSIINSEENGYE